MATTEPLYSLVLGSQSPRRVELLGHLTIPFVTIPSNIDELSDLADPRERGIDLAKQKAAGVRDLIAKDYPALANASAHPFIVAADTLVVLEGRYFAKPESRDHARTILMELAGKTHHVITGVCLSYKDRVSKTWQELAFAVSTAVTFTDIDEVTLEAYLSTGEHSDKAGAYGIQGAALTFVAGITGSYSNVVGLPLVQVRHEIQRALGENPGAATNWEKFFKLT